MILIITNTQDLTSDFVVREISRRNLSFARLNTDEFPSLGFGFTSFGLNESPQRIIRWKNRKKILDFKQVTSILYRRPVSPIPEVTIQNPIIRKFCIDESYDFLRGLWLSNKCHWMSYPEAIRKAEHKVYQLEVAQNMPFIIPKTIITNDPFEVRNFFYKCKNGMIIKPLYLGFINNPKNPQNIFTSIVTENDLEDVESVSFAPSIFQERVLKQYDIRVTVVGERVFTAKIETNDLPANIPDWRFAATEKLHHEKYILPNEIEDICIELVKRLELDFGAIDLAFDNEGNYVFFEINPNGQWAWLESLLGFPISEAIVNRLIEMAKE